MRHSGQTLITGLCEGADALAARQLDGLPFEPTHLVPELAAVIPFPLADYRRSRPEPFRDEFDAQVRRCRYILELDGKYDEPRESTTAKRRRQRAYRAQSTFLLRQADVLLALADPEAPGQAGGTLETVATALRSGLSVLFIHARTADVFLLEPGDDLGKVVCPRPSDIGDWEERANRLVDRLVAGADAATSERPPVDLAFSQDLLREFFAADNPSDASGGPRRLSRFMQSVGRRAWAGLMKRCRPAGRGSSAAPETGPYGVYRRRASRLSREYAGRYRGAFLLNYTLAAVAVMLAALSLVLMVLGASATPEQPLAKASGTAQAAGATAEAETDAQAGTVAGTEAASRERHVPDEEAHGMPAWLGASLLGLGLCKLVILFWIFLNTHYAAHDRLNDKAVDYRYLAERLRAMLFLPLIGSFQLPGSGGLRFAARVVHQSAVDWLAHALVRSAPPAADGETTEGRAILRLDPVKALDKVREDWLRVQLEHHEGNAWTMGTLHRFAEGWGRFLNAAVIGFVAVDLLILPLALLHLLGAWEHTLHAFAPWLVFLAATLPAVVASLNGIRYQSECRRLAERSAVMCVLLSGHAPAAKPEQHGWLPRLGAFCRWLGLSRPREERRGESAASPRGGYLERAEGLSRELAGAQTDPNQDDGAWTAEVLRFTEAMGETFLHEVSDWSVLYAKEMPEV